MRSTILFLLCFSLLSVRSQPKNRNLISSTSLISLQLVVNENGKPIEQATGFIVNYKESLYLVTNFHVLSGGWQPDKNLIDLLVDTKKSLTVKFKHYKFLTPIDTTYDLFSNGERQWVGINDRSNNTLDVAVLPLKDVPVDAYINTISLESFLLESDSLLSMGGQVMLVGYPLNITTETQLPIGATGFIASDPFTFPRLGKYRYPIFWVQAPNWPGASGSPVYFRDENYLLNKKVNRPLYRFIGLNSGDQTFPYSADSNIKVQFMMVWKGTVVKELIIHADSWVRSKNGGKIFKINLGKKPEEGFTIPLKSEESDKN